MTTKTDFHSIKELKENFKPKERGWIAKDEAAQVKNILELDARRILNCKISVTWP